MTKLYIPEIGDELILAEPWSFKLYAERRNETLLKHFGYICQFINISRRNLLGGYYAIPEEMLADRPVYRENYPGDYFEDINAFHTMVLDKLNDQHPEYIDVTLEAGTKLKIDRIYIRKGNKDFSSISFTTKDLGAVTIQSDYTWRSDRHVKALRFWAKLSECNNINFI